MLRGAGDATLRDSARTSQAFERHALAGSRFELALQALVERRVILRRAVILPATAGSAGSAPT